MSKAPHIAIALHRLTATGVAKNAQIISDGLRARGWRTTLVAMVPGPSDRDDTVILRPDLANAKRKNAQRQGMSSLRQWLSDERPDIFFSAGNHAHQTAARAARALQVPLVLRVSNSLDHRGGSSLMRAKFRAIKMGRLARLATRLVCVSKTIHDESSLAPARRSGKVTVIENGIDLSKIPEREFLPCPDILHGERPTVIAVGRLAKQKNLPILIAAIAKLRARQDVRLLLLGEGPDRADLEAQVRAANLQADVIFTGRVSDPLPYYAHSNVFALPSLWEGASNSLLEAIALQVPTVASRTAGNAIHVLGNGEFGRLHDPNDIDGLVHALQLQLNPDTCIAPGDRAEMFSVERTLDAYDALLRQILGAG